LIRDQDLRTSFRLWAADSAVLGRRLDGCACGSIDRVTAQGLVEAARLAAQLLDEDFADFAESAALAGPPPEPDDLDDLDVRMQVQVGRWLEQTRAMAASCLRNRSALGTRMAHALDQAARLVELRMVGYVVTVGNTRSLSPDGSRMGSRIT